MEKRMRRVWLLWIATRRVGKKRWEMGSYEDINGLKSTLGRSWLESGNRIRQSGVHRLFEGLDNSIK
jgi:hypothetical protein